MGGLHDFMVSAPSDGLGGYQVFSRSSSKVSEEEREVRAWMVALSRGTRSG